MTDSKSSHSVTVTTHSYFRAGRAETYGHRWACRYRCGCSHATGAGPGCTGTSPPADPRVRPARTRPVRGRPGRDRSTVRAGLGAPRSARVQTRARRGHARPGPRPPPGRRAFRPVPRACPVRRRRRRGIRRDLGLGEDVAAVYDWNRARGRHRMPIRRRGEVVSDIRQDRRLRHRGVRRVQGLRPRRRGRPYRLTSGASVRQPVQLVGQGFGDGTDAAV